MSAGGVIAAGHPLSAEAGAQILREGGNAVDAALAALFASFVCEPHLTGLGAGGYLLAAGFDEDPVLLDFFIAAPGFGRPAGFQRAPMVDVEVDFGDAVQVFNCGPASVGTWGMPAGVCAAQRRWGTIGLGVLVAEAARLAREGVELNGPQGYVSEILEGILTLTPACEALFAPGGRALRAGDRFAWPDLADALERLAADGEAPFYTGDVAAAILAEVDAHGGVLTAQDLAAYRAVERDPVRATFRGREVLTNPPPSAGGTLIAAALSLLDAGASDAVTLATVMERVQAARTDEFVAGLDDPGFAARFLASRLGSTTHVSVIDADGRACSITTSNGEGSGIVVPGTGIHANNMMGEEDLNPLGFHAFPPGRRMPSMMAPTIVLRDGAVELVVGSAGSNRIRSAILQVIAGVVDRGLDAGAAVDAPRLHVEGDGIVFCEPGIDEAALRASGREVRAFRAPNLFFGGVQAVLRTPEGRWSGAGDPRRGGAAVAVR